jgi:hypothetical protein
MDRGDVLRGAKNTYAGAASKAGQALGRLGLLSTPPHRDRRLQHWAYSLTRVHDSVAMAELDVPWWTYRAIDIVDAWLAARPHPVRVFEYGSGASTLWLGRRADEVYSVEHHRGFGEHMAPLFTELPSIRFHIVEPVESTHPSVPSAKEGHGNLDFADYVAAIDQVDGAFDLVVIDGRAREACLARAVPRIKPDGIILFDNSHRARYREAIAASGLVERRLRGLTPTLPYPEQTSLLSAK